MPEDKKYASPDVCFASLTLLRFTDALRTGTCTTLLRDTVEPFAMTVNEAALVSANLDFSPSTVRVRGRVRMET